MDMEKMGKMNFTPADNLIDDVWGKVGTPERDSMEARLKEEAREYFLDTQFTKRK